MKRFTKKEIAAVLVCLLILVGSGVYYFFFAHKSVKNNTYYNQAQDALQNREYALALSKYKEAVNLDPSLTDAYVQASNILTMKGKPTEAIDILKKGEGYAKDEDKLKVEISKVYASEGDFDNALSYAEKAKDEDSANYVKCLYLKGEYNKGLEVAQNMSAGDNTDLNYIKALTYFKDLDKAHEYSVKAQSNELTNAIQTAIDSKDNNIEDLMNISKASLGTNLKVYSLPLLNAVKEENKYYEGSYIFEAYVKNDYKKYDDSLSLLKTASLYAPNNYEVYKLMAFSYYEKQDNENALKYINKTLTYPNLSTDTNFLAFKIFKRNAKYPEAIKQVDVLLKADAANFEYAKAKVDLLMTQGRYSEAKVLANSYIDSGNFTTKEQQSVLLAYRGWSNYNLGSKADAKNDFDNAISLSERNAYVNYYYGMMLAGQQDTQKAREALNIAIDVDLEGEISTLAAAQLEKL